MEDKEQQFYLISTELRNPYPPIKCVSINRLQGEIRNDYMLIKLSSPLNKEIYNTYKRKQDLEYLIIASRFKDEKLFPLSHECVNIYICGYKDNISMEMKKVEDEKIILLDKGQVYKSYESAIKNSLR